MHLVIEFLSDNLFLSILISILLNIFISIIGVIPSAFLTSINIKLFGFSGSLIIGFIGESLGAAVSFWLYRKGLLKLENKVKIPEFIRYYQMTNTSRSFFLILLLRFLPFIPSSLITFIAALGSIHFIYFFIASSIGKIPALFFEVYSMNSVLKIMNLPILLLTCIVVWLIYYFIKKKKYK